MRSAVLAVLCACSIPPFAGALPEAGPNGHDEDNDGIGDADDPCPHLPAPMGVHDTDNDGIGDDCDPFPDDNADSKRFYSFATDLGDLRVDGSAHLDGEDLVLGTTANGFNYVWVPSPTFRDVRIEIAFEVVDGNATERRQVAIRSNHPFSITPGDAAGLACDLGYVPPPLDHGFFDISNDNTDTLQNVDSTQGQLVGVSGHMRVEQLGGGYRCTLDMVSQGAGASITPISGTQPPLQSDEVGVMTESASARIHYLFVAGR